MAQRNNGLDQVAQGIVDKQLAESTGVNPSGSAAGYFGLLSRDQKKAAEAAEKQRKGKWW